MFIDAARTALGNASFLKSISWLRLVLSKLFDEATARHTSDDLCGCQLLCKTFQIAAKREAAERDRRIGIRLCKLP